MERGRRRAVAGLCVLREGDGFRILRRRRFRLSRPGRGSLLCRDRDGFRILRRRQFRLSRPGRGSLLCRDSVSCRAIS
ncbi:hypothetical protein Taro_014892 [Colocasia esculenta]|uniref:Uncharacterized protein n=1 Tax=Colocasia esculenta TaxID=4460 RepID=A0A843UJE1_COLES|nr:hypothetical protein [Colocasia esculenta]